MVLNWDLITGANLILCVLIFISGCWAYSRTNDRTPFYVAVAFGLFALAHVIKIMALEHALITATVLIRIFAYFIVLTVVYEIGKSRK